jgi:hypothetical protein
MWTKPDGGILSRSLPPEFRLYAELSAELLRRLPVRDRTHCRAVLRALGPHLTAAQLFGVIDVYLRDLEDRPRPGRPSQVKEILRRRAELARRYPGRDDAALDVETARRLGVHRRTVARARQRIGWPRSVVLDGVRYVVEPDTGRLTAAS